MKIFHIRDKVSVSWCQFYMNMLPVDYLLDYRKFKYYNKMSKSQCYVMKHLYENSASALTDNIYKTYGITESMSQNKFLLILWDKFHSSIDSNDWMKS